jgi:hypothetical protein
MKELVEKIRDQRLKEHIEYIIADIEEKNKIIKSLQNTVNNFNLDDTIVEKDNEIKYSFERKSILEDCENYFYQWLEKNNYDVKKVKILTGLIYLNIAALHHNPYCHLLFNLGKTMLYKNI